MDTIPQGRALGSRSDFSAPKDPSKPSKPLHPTAWLDGLRGVAAFLVVCHHWSLLTFTIRIHKGYMSDAQPLFIQLPIIRLVVSGYWAVSVFFVISGFALSYKPLKLATQRRTADFTVAVASSTFRRWIRIFLPPAMISLPVCIMAYMGWFETQADLPGVLRLRPPIAASLPAQLWDWFMHTIAFADPLSRNPRRGGNYAYDPIYWTIPIEFDCSLVVFLAHVAFARLRPRPRLFFHCLIAFYTLYFGRWEFFLFLAGLLCADLHFFWQSDSDTAQEEAATWDTLPLWSKPWRRGSLSRFQSAVTSSSAYARTKTALGILSFFCALWLLSYPKQADDAGSTPGYKTLTAMALSRHSHGVVLWIPLGAFLLVLTIDRTPLLQRLFTARLSQYLARVSFAMYLVHGALLWLWGWHLLQFFAGLTGTANEVQYCFAVFFATIFFLGGTVCVADFVQRFVDARAVAFSKWVESKLVEKLE